MLIFFQFFLLLVYYHNVYVFIDKKIFLFQYTLNIDMGYLDFSIMRYIGYKYDSAIPSCMHYFVFVRALR